MNIFKEISAAVSFFVAMVLILLILKPFYYLYVAGDTIFLVLAPLIVAFYPVIVASRYFFKGKKPAVGDYFFSIVFSPLCAFLVYTIIQSVRSDYLK